MSMLYYLINIVIIIIITIEIGEPMWRVQKHLKELKEINKCFEIWKSLETQRDTISKENEIIILTVQGQILEWTCIHHARENMNKRIEEVLQGYEDLPKVCKFLYKANIQEDTREILKIRETIIGLE